MKRTSPRRQFLKTATLLALGGPPLLHAADKPASGKPKPTVMRTAELMQQQPNQGLWNLHQSATSRTNLVQMRGQSIKHIHPDAEHSLYVISGELTALVEAEAFELRAGDYISIPAGVLHGYKVPEGKTALLISMDAPPYDPAKTIRSKENK
jgi:mannose-6-phosphate isomerase-like protein (cupin superfamily)